MKKIILTGALLLGAVALNAQPQLDKDNIDDVLKAMTLEEKATLVVGSGWGSMTAGSLTASSTVLVPGAAGTYKVMFGANATDIRATGVYKLKKAESWKVNNVLAPAETIEELSLN